MRADSDSKLAPVSSGQGITHCLSSIKFNKMCNYFFRDNKKQKKFFFCLLNLHTTAQMIELTFCCDKAPIMSWTLTQHVSRIY